MRVSFVFLNSDSPVGFSHGVAVLSRELKESGHDVSLVHVSERLGLPFDLERIGRRLVQQAPDVVALSFGSNHASAAEQVAAEAKGWLPDVPVVAGGIHVTLDAEEALSWPGVDYVGLGEMDDFRLVRMLEGLAQDRLPEPGTGFWYRHEGRVVRSPILPPVELDAAPRAMDLDLFDHRRIIELKRGYADAISGRGCPFGCSYCHNDALRDKYLRDLGCASRSELNYVRKRPVEEVIAELRDYRDRYADVIRVFSFTDDVFITSRRWLYEFLAAYRAEFDLPLVFCSTVSLVDEKVARACGEAGVYMVRVGVESGSAVIREKIMNRPYRARSILRSVRALQEAGVNVLTFNMLAVPTESMRDVWSTFRFAARLRSDAHQFSIFWPYPGTALHTLCVERGLLDPGASLQGNYLSASPLRWHPRRQRFYERIRGFYAAAVNRFLVSDTAEDHRRLLRDLARIPEATWRDGGESALRERAAELSARIIAGGGEAYTTPFTDRPDILIRQGRSRRRKLINV